jgi:hydrogenase nickel incorporation protein HypA/HybF
MLLGAADIMHELSLARDLLSTIESRLYSDRVQVVRIDLEIGSASGIVVDSLRFAFEVIAKGSKAEGAALSILSRPARSRCSSCGRCFEFEGLIGVCPNCGRLGGELLSGSQMMLRSIEVRDV